MGRVLRPRSSVYSLCRPWPPARQEACSQRLKATCLSQRTYTSTFLFYPFGWMQLMAEPLTLSQWLLSRHEKAGVDPRYAWPQASYANYQNGAQYGQGANGMYPMPPPVYDPNNRPPMYEGGVPPMGGSKVDPVQTGIEPARQPDNDYAPPPGPPPSAAQR